MKHESIIAAVRQAPAREVTMRELSDCGLNPFACQLLVESFDKAGNAETAVVFLYGGKKMALVVVGNPAESSSGEVRPNDG